MSILAKRLLVSTMGVGLAGFLAIQFIRPEISHPPVTAELEAPAEVKQILTTSCYDCHSNVGALAWFDQIVPAYWLVVSDVRQARRKLNFSTIGNLPPAQQKGMLWEAVNQIQAGAMPLPAYARLHHGTTVTADQLNVLKNYLKPADSKSASANDLAADREQYEHWLGQGGAAPAVSPAPNGIAFPADYKTWRPISTTDRFDNQTLRGILGNSVAIQAIAEGKINPWPDGTTFAKIAWQARDDGQGQIHTGAFLQVEFMIRDRKKYAATKGWGWARWRGENLTPYGKDAGFPEECVGCHAPVAGNDYVFTFPVRALSGELPWNPMQLSMITSAVNKRDSSMSTFYGNDLAVNYARRNSQQEYPAGSVLSLVTWTEKEDSRWFGGRIPEQVKSVEFVSLASGANPQYQRYEGTPLHRVENVEEAEWRDRATYLLGLRAAVMP